MRTLLATACICILASAASVAAGHGAGASADGLTATAERLAPPDDTFDPLPPGVGAVAPKPKAVVDHPPEIICDTITAAAQRNDLPVPFFIRLLFQESRFRPGAVSRAGAQGIAQFMPRTADAVGLDNPFDPLQAIPASARLLRDLFERFGNLGLAAAAYNAGPKRIHDWLESKGRLPEETRGYVKTVTGLPAERWKGAGPGAPAVKLPPRAPCQDAAGLLAADGPESIPLPEASPHRRALALRHADTAPAKLAAHARHPRETDTVNLAARRKPARHHRPRHHGRRRRGREVAAGRRVHLAAH